ncbi:MAG: hypothetical protein A2860_04005 [Candidatus Levybacteria bacterium RIFCSPHIGHO2_01_FULL_37_33]|nr:MAG: hypothetical protein A2860_04005 [Candidatus Levybacteria bacterium RIFCSPHIGHO2_01_FULL_37_33]OGH30046.1 MAG: hypothetical protein A3F30_04165 [Candidatus Levybacteria bacterium RIFCSPHIGHO2_12_FULL_37_12]
MEDFLNLLDKLYKEIPKIENKFKNDSMKNYYLFKCKAHIEQTFYVNLIKNIINNLDDPENIKDYGYSIKDIERIKIQEEIILKKLGEINSNDILNEVIITKQEYQQFANSVEKISEEIYKFIDYFENTIQLKLCEEIINKQEGENFQKFLHEKNFNKLSVENIETSKNDKINCTHCGSSNFNSLGSTAIVHKNITSVSIRFNRNFYCNSCYKYFYTNYIKTIDNYTYINCPHDILGFSNLLAIGVQLSLPVKLCLLCGSRLVTCQYLKSEVDKYYPAFWKKIKEETPYEVKTGNCKFCSNEDITNSFEMDGHVRIRALGLCKSNNPDLFDYFFKSTETPEVIKDTLRIDELYKKIKSLDWSSCSTSLLKRQELKDKKNLRTSLYEKIKSKQKLFDFYIGEATNYYRKKFGLPLIGEKWISETTLFKLIKQIYEDKEVVFHSRPNWLQGLELDIYIPEERLAIEYMGRQHHEPVSFFGGEESFLNLVERDERKEDICIKNGIALIHFDYRMTVNKENILKLIRFAQKV